MQHAVHIKKLSIGRGQNGEKFRIKIIPTDIVLFQIDRRKGPVVQLQKIYYIYQQDRKPRLYPSLM
jgi:hypothetical protein